MVAEMVWQRVSPNRLGTSVMSAWTTSASSQQPIKNFSFGPIFYRGKAVGVPGDDVRKRMRLLTDGGMVTVFQIVGNMFLHGEKG